MAFHVKGYIRKQVTSKIKRGDCCPISFQLKGKFVILTCIHAVTYTLDKGSDEKKVATP